MVIIMTGKTMYYYSKKYPQCGIKEFVISDAAYVCMESNPLDASVMNVRAYYDISISEEVDYENLYTLIDTDIEDLYGCEMGMSSYSMSTNKELIEERWKNALDYELKRAQMTIASINALLNKVDKNEE